jgi:L-alanine-DL-glutamate epimerase-like enolase superfamily enzyme
MSSIVDIDVNLFRVPLPLPWGPAVRYNYLVTCRLTDSEGQAGIGFTWTPHVGACAIVALLLHDCREAIEGGPTHPAVVWPRLWKALHEAGGGGITTLGMAAIDTALWDLMLRRHRLTLGQYLGAQREVVSSYGSGINYDDDLDTLASQTRRWVDAGYEGVKIKVGHPSLEDDVERCRLVREIIGPGRRLMIDANQRWNLDQATRAIDRLVEFDLHWVEEPLRADDIEGYQRLRRRVDVALALGENQRTIYEFRRLLTLGACDIIQPNLARVGGITPFLQISALGHALGARVCPHHLPEISRQLALCLPEQEMIEDIDQSSFVALGMLKPAAIESDAASRTGEMGLGLEFDFERLQPFAVALK